MHAARRAQSSVHPDNVGCEKPLALSGLRACAGIVSRLTVDYVTSSPLRTVAAFAYAGLIYTSMGINDPVHAQTLAAGAFHNCTVSSTGGLVCWGVNDAGQIGDNSTITRAKPVNVPGVSFNNPSLAGGFQHTCAVESTGAVKCWGKNDKGQLGDNTVTNRLTPTPVSGLANGQSAVTAGDSHSCALSSTGGVKCWGYNNDGQLGNSSNAEQHVPVDVTGLTSGVSTIAAGYIHTCAVTTSGAAKCWGSNEWWQLGDGSDDFTSNLPVNVSGLTSGVTAIAGGDLHTCAIVSGGVKCWGYNAEGAVGDGTNVLRQTPANVSGLSSGAVAISAGASHTCALLTGGSVKCWGYNAFGQLGDGTNTSSNAPVTAVSSGAIAVAAGAAHTCALTGAGTSLCWGNNPSGQIGDGTVGGQSYIPVSTQYPAATSVTLSTSGTPSTFGDNVTFTATVSGGMNGVTVAFQSDGVNIAGCGAQTIAAGTATCSTSTLGGGTIAVTAIYQGNSTTLASRSAPFSQVVNKSDQTIAFDPLANKQDTDPPFAISASASSGLAVTFSSLTPSVCTVSANSATLQPSQGGNICTIAADQPGSGNFNAAAQVTQSFSVIASGPALALVAVESRKAHGTAGTFSITINPSTAISGLVDVEPRLIGGGHVVAFVFNTTVTAIGGVSLTDKDSLPIGSAMTSVSGNEVLVTITGVPDARRIKISLTGINPGSLSASASVGFFVGDVSGNRLINSSDLGLIKGRSGVVTAATFRYDINVNGLINASDLGLVKGRSGALP